MAEMAKGGGAESGAESTRKDCREGRAKDVEGCLYRQGTARANMRSLYSLSLISLAAQAFRYRHALHQILASLEVTLALYHARLPTHKPTHKPARHRQRSIRAPN